MIISRFNGRFTRDLLTSLSADDYRNACLNWRYLTECLSVSFDCMTVTAGWRHLGGGLMMSLWLRQSHDFYITYLFTVIFAMMGQDVFLVTPPPKEVRPRSNLCSIPACSVVAIGIRLPRALRKPIVVFTARSVAYVARYCHHKESVRMSVRL